MSVRHCLVVALRLLAGVPLAAVSISAGAQIFGVIDGPIDLLADVTEAANPGGILFSDNMRVPGRIAGPKQTAEYFHLALRFGANPSGRGPGSQTAFVSSLAESDGNGGVGVSALAFSRPAGTGTTGYGSLVSQAAWTQTFVHTGGPASAANISLHVNIPELQLSLYGVAPRRSAPSDTETAEATANITTFITRADGSTGSAFSFEYGMRLYESQILLGPGTYSNFVSTGFIGSFTNTVTQTGPTSWALAPYSTDVTLGTLDAGDTLTYVYTLIARGTTNGGEKGFSAFIGDPFGVNVVGNNLRSVITPVPEPQDIALWLVGLAWLGWRRLGARKT